MCKTPTKLQVFAVRFWVVVFLLGFFIFPIIAVLLLFTPFRLPIILYLLWVYLIDKDIGDKGGRPVEFFRNLSIWKHFADYFPVTSVLSSPLDLDPKRNYMFVSFPHGVICIGASVEFRFHGHFRKLFPALRPCSVTLPFNFSVPFYRDLVLATGSCSSSKESIDYLLSDPKGGRAVGIVPGGASETVYSHPGGTYKILLKKRKGFVKLALTHGSPMIPLFSFGEIDLYEQVIPVEASLASKIIKYIKRLTRINFVVPRDGVPGFVPFNRPVTVVCKW